MTPAKIRGGNQGQVQILGAAALSTAMLTVALFSLQYSQQTETAQVRAARVTEIRTVLDQAIKQASYLYRAEAACDPVSLDNLLARINPDGTINVYNPALAKPTIWTLRQLAVTLNNHSYTVAFGPVTRLPWRTLIDPTKASYDSGVSQDAVVEVWASFNGQRVKEQAVLINNCTYPCASAAAGFSDQCQVAADASIAYHEIKKPDIYPASPLSSSKIAVTCEVGRAPGNIKTAAVGPGVCAPAAAGPGVININDVVILKSYLRSGDPSGSCSTTIASCADLNNDQQIDGNDLNILEKYLRGYIYWLPVHY